MMSDHEVSMSSYKDAESTYGKYEGHQSMAHQQYGSEDEQPTQAQVAEKVYVPPRSNKNALIILVGILALITTIIVAIICAVSGAGAVGWIGVGITSIGIFLITATIIEKLQ